MPRRSRTSQVLMLLSMPGAAAAHHPTGGMPPSGALEGLLSGLAHPVLGPEHALMLVALALVALHRRRVVRHALVHVGANASAPAPSLVGLVTVQACTVLGIGIGAARLDGPARRLAVRATALACATGAIVAGRLA